MCEENTAIEEKVEHRSAVLVAARPDRMRDSLCLMLGMMHGIDVVGLADDSSSTLGMVSEHHPALVLLNTNLPGEDVATVLKRIKANGTRSRCIVLADTLAQQQEAKSAGADMALVKGFPAAELREAIEGCTREETETKWRE